MKEIFDNLSSNFSKDITKRYSTSFSLGILFLDKKYRQPIYNVYGFVRLADEIVDSFHQFNKKELLERFRQNTYEAIHEGISLNPILNSFQETVNTFNIDEELIGTFLDSMEMDLQKLEYQQVLYEKYILGSAEVVGLMCLKIFTEGDEKLFQDLKPFAMRLGAAFQKVNFLRDLKDDVQDLGRSYFPGFAINGFTHADKKNIEAEIEEDFNQALQGIKLLPGGSRRGVYLAYYYYKNLFHKIRRASLDKVLSNRIRIPNSHKFLLMVNSYLRHQLNLL
jgi:phytoene/squalene synthetase